MGITVHFTGRVSDPSRVDAAIAAAVVAAERQGWAAQRFEKTAATLRRSSMGREWEYSGPTRGVVITPHEQSDPLSLEFDGDGVVQDFVKTQFAGPETHMAVIALLRELQPTFDAFEVVDEGEYWDTGDREQLTRHIVACNAQLVDYLRRNDKLRGPIRLENGRMLDLVQIDEGAPTPEKPWWRFW